MQVEDAVMPEPESTGGPVKSDERRAPAGLTQFGHPLPEAPKPPQGHCDVCVVSRPSPKQNVACTVQRSRTKTSATALTSPTTRLVAMLVNATRRPSADTPGRLLCELAS